MKRKLLSVYVAVLLGAAQGTIWANTTVVQEEATPTVTYYSEKFQSGKPTNMTYYDGDGLVLNSYLNGTGLECGTWHIVRNSYEDTNYFMASTSYFVMPGQANDWMITPQIKIYGEGATLSWKAMTCDNSSKLDGFKVYVSTQGTAVADFEEEPIYTVEEAGSAGWTTHQVGLDKYAGKLIHIAFVNDSYDKYVLAIDDILVTGPQPKAVWEFTTPAMTDTGKANVSVKITNTQDTPISSCKIHYVLGGETYTQEHTALNLTKGNTLELSNETSLEVPVNQSRHYTAWIEVDGDKYQPVTDSIIGTYFVSNRRTVLEEGTGNWCSACPMGIVAMDYMIKTYPDNFIGIAVHCDNDPMLLSSYQQFHGFPVFPCGYTDRKFLSAPYSISENGHFTLVEDGFEGFYLKAQEQIAVGQIEGTAEADAANPYEVKISLETRFIQDMQHKGYNIAMIILEDDVTAPDGTLYKQTNSFTAPIYQTIDTYGLHDTIPGIGGFGGGANEVPMLYDHVARGAVAESYDGLDADFPSPVEGGKIYTNELTYVIPEGMVNNLSKTSIVALLIDASTGFIVNACHMPIVGLDGVETVLTGDEVCIAPVGGHCINVAVQDASDVFVEVFDVSGRRVWAQELYVSATFSLQLPETLEGIYLVKVSVGEKSVSRKIQW